MRKRLLLMATFVSALVGGGTAVAHEVTHDSRVNLHYATGEFSGKVHSTHDRCEDGRTVKIFLVDGDERTLVEQTKTDEDGFYAIASEDAAEGEYFARVTREVLDESSEHSHVCAPDRSPTLKVKNSAGGP